jgi:hypothetical protein
MEFLTPKCFVKERKKDFNGIVTKQSIRKDAYPGVNFSFFLFFCGLDLRWPHRSLCRLFGRDANPEICHGIKTFWLKTTQLSRRELPSGIWQKNYQIFTDLRIYSRLRTIFNTWSVVDLCRNYTKNYPISSGVGSDAERSRRACRLLAFL